MIRVELTEEEWARLLNAAALAPYGQIAQVLEKAAMQIQEQKQPMKGAANGPLETQVEALHPRN